MSKVIERYSWWIIAAITAVGLALRVAAAQGGLWLDEAWSAVMAHQATTPLGVFLNINHDNNHHLNSLWLQFVGIDASPMAQRALSILAGTAVIAVVALIGARRSAVTAILTALFFAISPILVTYGSEARGYAPMLLSLLVAIWFIDQWLGQPDAPPPALPVALAALLGLLAQLTMSFGLAALGLWTLWALRKRRPTPWRDILRLWGPAAIASALALALIFVPAWNAGGMTFGSAEPFAFRPFTDGLGQALHHSLGHIYAVALVALAAMLLGLPIGRLAICSYALLLAAPAIVLLGQFPNVWAARLYLVSVAGLLLLFALMLGNGFARGQQRVTLALAGCALVVMAFGTATLVRDRRADPAQALAAIAAKAPAGADAALDRPRSEAILFTAAASASYPLQIRQSCPPARFLFIERDGNEPFPARPTHCASQYREIAGNTVRGLSGTQWKLYERSAR